MSFKRSFVVFFFFSPHTFPLLVSMLLTNVIIVPICSISKISTRKSRGGKAPLNGGGSRLWEPVENKHNGEMVFLRIRPHSQARGKRLIWV